MTTFSQLVDTIVAETRRPDMLADFVSYLNQTIREVHFEPAGNSAVFFEENYREDQVRITTHGEVASWDIPNPARFQGIAAIRYDNVTWNREVVYAKKLKPGIRMDSEPFVYQRVKGQVMLKGAGGYNAVVTLAYYEFPPALKYYPVTIRPASYDVVDGWTYHDSIEDSEEAREVAQDAVTNWLIMRWATVLEEGLRAKVYKRLSDETRQRTSYSLYTQLRQGLYTTEVADLGGSY